MRRYVSLFAFTLLLLSVFAVAARIGASTDSYLSSDGDQWARIAGPPNVLPVELADWVEVTAARPIGPVLSVRVDAPAKLDVTNGQYTPNPFSVVATVSNQGIEAATDVNIAVTLPTGLTLVGAVPLTSIGLLQPGESRQVQWSVSAAAQGQETTLTYTVAASASEVPNRAVSRQIMMPPFPFSTSYYMSTINTGAAFRLGCAARKQGEQGIVVLNFGSPRNLGTKDIPVLGTRLFGVRKDRVTLAQIASAVESFALGYQHIEVCDAPPANPRVPDLTIAIGTTNSKVFVDDDPTKPFGDNEVLNATYTRESRQITHGEEWARMVDSVNIYLSATNAKSIIRAAGAYDAEFGISEWSSFASTLDWAKSFDKTGLALYYDFGSCDGCPTDPQASNWNEGHKQVMQRVYKLAWDIPSARPLPQIYYANQAQQWANVRWYVHQPPYNRSMFINGAMTSCVNVKRGCDITDTTSWQNIPSWQILSPSQGWNALSDSMDNPIAPNNAPNTIPQTRLPWLTDIIDQP